MVTAQRLLDQLQEEVLYGGQPFPSLTALSDQAVADPENPYTWQRLIQYPQYVYDIDADISLETRNEWYQTLAQDVAVQSRQVWAVKNIPDKHVQNLIRWHRKDETHIDIFKTLIRYQHPLVVEHLINHQTFLYEDYHVLLVYHGDESVLDKLSQHKSELVQQAIQDRQWLFKHEEQDELFIL